MAFRWIQHLSLSNITKLSSKQKLTLSIDIVFENTFVKFLPRLENWIHTTSRPSLTYFYVQLFRMLYLTFHILNFFFWKLWQFSITLTQKDNKKTAYQYTNWNKKRLPVLDRKKVRFGNSRHKWFILDARSKST